MKIGVDARPLTVPTFGIGRYTQEILQRLVELAPEDSWFLYADRPLQLSFAAPNVFVRDFPSHNRVASLARTQLTFAHWANRDKLDAFWSPRHHLPLMLSADIRKLVTVHDLVWQKFPETMLKANLFVERLLMPGSVKQADRIIAVSQATRSDLLEAFAVVSEKVDVICEAAGSVTDVNPLREIVDDYFLFIGTHEPRKNLKRLAEAFTRYRSQGGSLKLVLVGASGWGDVEQSLQDDSAILKLGYMGDDQLNGVIYHAHALVMPSLYEGFGLPIVEALQRGVPAITSNLSSMPEVVGKAGLLVDPLDVGSIQNALLEMSQPSVHARCASECETQSAKFSWDRAAEETLSVIRSLG